ncbi:MAG TPA: universal stress protein [Thermoanaerobaculia bacterium]|nr:universal stress protein [Thermoanaerobaculia bacterium]
MARNDKPFTSSCAANRLETVLVGTALDDDSDAVVRVALAAARAAGARLHVVHAIEIEPVEMALDPMWLTGELVEEITAERRRALAAQLTRLAAGQEIASSSVVRGEAYRVLLDAAQSARAGLIVVGAARAMGTLGRLLGSTADRLLRKSSRPLLVVRGRLALPPERVLAPVDLAPLSLDALRYGLHLLRQTGDGAPARLTALHVLDPAAHPTLRHRQMSPAELDAAEDAARAALTAVAADCRALEPVAVEAALRSGDPSSQILAAAEEAGADLLLMGTHSRSPLDRLLLGSVAAQVVREAHCSVLAVPPEAALGAALAEAVVAGTEPAFSSPSALVAVR